MISRVFAAMLLLLALTACQERRTSDTVGYSATDNSFAVVGDIKGGPGKKGRSYVECTSPVSAAFRVSVPDEQIPLMRLGITCPNGKRW